MELTSFSKVDCFTKCPFQYKLRYIDKLKTLSDPEPDNALICGSTIDRGIENGVEEAVRYYYKCFNIIDDRHIHEEMKIRVLIPKVKELLRSFNNPQFQTYVKHESVHGYIDLVTENSDGTVNIYDFKYSNNTKYYLESSQVHIYKMLYEGMKGAWTNPGTSPERMQGKVVKEIGYIFIPKTAIRQKNTETLQQFRNRLINTLAGMQVELTPVKYDWKQVANFYDTAEEVNNTTEYPKNPTKLCDWCDYKEYCFENEEVNIMLPSTERRTRLQVNNKTIWIYGAPFSGKTTFANAFPTPLMLNTDGNIKFVDAPFIALKDEVIQAGRITKRKLAWEIFKDAISELELHQNDFKTSIVDLLEDVYDHCRVYMYDKMNIEHESDNSFKAWDMVRNEFLREIKRLMSLNYDIVLVSHEDTSKDVTKRSGDKITRIAPNIQEKIANKVAGMVDVVARIIADDGDYTLNFKTSEVIFGGGRLNFKIDKILLEYNDFVELYKTATPNTRKDNALSSESKNDNSKRMRNKADKQEDVPPENTNDEKPVIASNEAKESPKIERKRRSRKEG
jgi:phage nucleotide-binding protein